jgi:hypothetical protein
MPFVNKSLRAQLLAGFGVVLIVLIGVILIARSTLSGAC